MQTVKFVGAWGFLVAAIAFLVIGHFPAGIPVTCSLISLGFSQAPSNVN